MVFQISLPHELLLAWRQASDGRVDSSPCLLRHDFGICLIGFACHSFVWTRHFDHHLPSLIGVNATILGHHNGQLLHIPVCIQSLAIVPKTHQRILRDILGIILIAKEITRDLDHQWSQLWHDIFKLFAIHFNYIYCKKPRKLSDGVIFLWGGGRSGVQNWDIKSMEIVRKSPICGSVRAESPASSYPRATPWVPCFPFLRPVRAKVKVNRSTILLPLQGVGVYALIPRALPWAMNWLPFQGAPFRALFVYHVRFVSPLAIWLKIAQRFFWILNTLPYSCPLSTRRTTRSV